MKKLILSLLASLALLGSAQANTAGPAWDKFPTQRMTDLAALLGVSEATPWPQGNPA